MAENDNHNKGIDLSGRLKDSGTGVQFQNEWRPAARASSPSTPRVVRWVMENSGGYVKDKKQASYVLLGFAAVAIVISLFLIFGGDSDTSRTLQENFKNKPQFLP
ncbi:MAG: hypothetical protein AAB604_01840 [Patescibacteria group bacterium]